MLLFKALAVLLLPSAWALFPDEAYKIDYHHALLGIPQRHTTFIHQPLSNSKATLIYTLSDRFLLGAVNPRDGSLLWRQSLASNSTSSVLIPGNGQISVVSPEDHQSDSKNVSEKRRVDPRSGRISVVSGVDHQVASWNAWDGRLIWSREHDLPGKLIDLNIVDAGQDGRRKDVVGLFQADTPVLQKLDGRSGAALWQYIDSSSDIPFQLAASPSHVFYISFSTSLKKLKVMVLNPSNGQKLDQITINSDEVTSLDDVSIVARSKSPVIVWTDSNRRVLKVNVLGSKSISSFNTTPGNGERIQSIIVHSPNVDSAKPHFLVQYQSPESHWGEVFHVIGTDTKPTVEKIYDVARLAGKGTFAASVADDKIYFTRIAAGAFLALDSDENKIVDHYPIQNFGLSSVLDHPEPILAVAEVNPRSGSNKYAIRAATLFNTGDWSLNLNGESSWVRHEGLAYITAATFAELPKKQGLAHELELEGHSTIIKAYIHRVQRHIHNLQKLPEFLRQLPEKVINVALGKESVVKKDDVFGFYKHVLVATESGRLAAINTVDGNVVWSTNIPEFQRGEIPQLAATPNGIVRIKTDSSHSVFDIATGKFLRKGTDSGASSRATTASASVRFVSTPDFVAGYLGDVHSNDAPIWTFYPQTNEKILNVTMRPSFDPVASIGDVLGDRRVLYKYLNPNLVLITAVSESSVTFYVIDGVSGNALHTVTHNQVDVTQPIPALLAENMLVYSLTLSNSSTLRSRGYILGISKFYESSLADDRGPLSSSKTFSTLESNATLALSPFVISQSFHIPEPISSLSISRTAQGITTRLLLATLPFSGGLLSIPLPAVDPRRPVGRQPTKDEQAEGLVPYLPNLEFDPKWFLSHKRDVRGLETVIASPSGMESTGLVFGYGGDVFGTRVTPSGGFDVLGDGFAKGNMVGTVVALLVLTLIVAPIVGKRANDVRWSVPQ